MQIELKIIGTTAWVSVNAKPATVFEATDYADKNAWRDTMFAIVTQEIDNDVIENALTHHILAGEFCPIDPLPRKPKAIHPADGSFFEWTDTLAIQNMENEGGMHYWTVPTFAQIEEQALDPDPNEMLVMKRLVDKVVKHTGVAPVTVEWYRRSIWEVLQERISLAPNMAFSLDRRVIIYPGTLLIQGEDVIEGVIAHELGHGETPFGCEDCADEWAAKHGYGDMHVKAFERVMAYHEANKGQYDVDVETSHRELPDRMAYLKMLADRYRKPMKRVAASV